VCPSLFVCLLIVAWPTTSVMSLLVQWIALTHLDDNVSSTKDDEYSFAKIKYKELMI
jgi:hypothetical protein